ncbi:hypothetical protein J7K93_06645 [bacterium]|nr:hypothetical protein [bacterium]
MNLKNMRADKYWVLVLIILNVFILSCQRENTDQPSERILARVGDKTISVNEFIRRAEYTIRPIYCRKDNYIHRKIVLNSLIAEKLLALEAGDDNKLVKARYFQDYLKGRQEQSMRQWFFYHNFFQRVKLSPQKINERMKLVGRKYDISYFSVSDPYVAHKISKTMHDTVDFKIKFNELSNGADLPRRFVKWNNLETREVINALYSGSPQKGDIIGTLKQDTNYIFIKINGWTERVYLSESTKKQLWKDVKEQMQHEVAEEKYVKFVKGLMKRKKLRFNTETFKTLVPILADNYLKSQEEKKAAFNNRFWKKESYQKDLDNHSSSLKDIIDQPLFTVDGQTWTVRQFELALVPHPLVFRKYNIPKSEFAEQLKFAIADLIRDQFITQEAYKHGYENVNAVKRNVSMWRDNLLAIYKRNSWLKSNNKEDEFESNIIKTIEKDLNPYIRSLMKKYNNEIEIDTDLFEKIKLSGINSFMTQRNMPFKIMVPSFPVITNLNKLDYGRKMQH